MIRSLLLLMAASTALPASAHLMVARHGTLNLTDEGGYLMLSVPVAAFPGLDADGDGRASEGELAGAMQDVSTRIHDGVLLSDDAGPRPLEGLLVHGADHDAATNTHVLITGRFDPAEPEGPLTFSFELFAPGDQPQKVRIRRGEHVVDKVFLPHAPELVLRDAPADTWARAGIGPAQGASLAGLFVLGALTAGALRKRSAPAR